MGIKTHHGFTIIEVMLFLAVSGALTVAILVGSGVSIGQQRYRDSVNSLKSFVQDQYSEVTNVVNDRDNNWTCNTAGMVTESPAGDGQLRGTSDCVLLGRFVTVDNTGTKLTASNVVGQRQSGATVGASDIDELKNYALTVSPITPESSEVNWSAQIVKPKTAGNSNPMPISLLIIRSPLSGAVVTFTIDGAPATIDSMVNVGNTAAKDLCVNGDVGTFVGQRLAVRISAFATSQGAIQIPPESDNICD